MCATEKPRTDFSPDKKAGDGLASRCRACHRVACKASRDRHIEKERARGRAKYYANADRYRAYARE